MLPNTLSQQLRPFWTFLHDAAHALMRQTFKKSTFYSDNADSVITRAVVDTVSRQCRDIREFRDCRHAIFTLSTVNSVLGAENCSPVATVAIVRGPTVDRQVSVATTALVITDT